jgi:hypothetical protein
VERLTAEEAPAQPWLAIDVEKKIDKGLPLIRLRKADDKTKTGWDQLVSVGILSFLIIITFTWPALERRLAAPLSFLTHEEAPKQVLRRAQGAGLSRTRMYQDDVDS